MGILDSANLSSAANSVAGGEKGAKTRNLTLLPTDKLISNLIILVPFGLILVANFLTPGAFKSGSILCTKEHFYQTNAEPETCTKEYYEMVDKKWTLIRIQEDAMCSPGNPESEMSVGGIINDKQGKFQTNARQFFNNYCWENENLVHHEYEDAWTDVDLVRTKNGTHKIIEKGYGKKHGYKKGISKESLLVQKFWLYIIVGITAIAASPQLYWSYNADDEIQPFLKFYKECLIKLIKSLILAAQSDKSVDEYFHFSRSAVREVRKEEKEEIQQQLDDKAEGEAEAEAAAVEAALDGREEEVIEIKNGAESPQAPIVAEKSLDETALLQAPKPLTKQEAEKQTTTRLITEFQNIAQFFNKQAESNVLIKKVMLYRLMNIASMIVAIFLLCLYSLSNTRNFFTCKVDFTAENSPNYYYEYVVCSISGVGMRLDMTKCWILAYLLLILTTVIGSLHEWRAFKNLEEYDNILGLFQGVWPDEFNKIAGGEDVKSRSDLKYLTLLASNNLSNIYIRSLFTLVHYADMLIAQEKKIIMRKRGTDYTERMAKFDSVSRADKLKYKFMQMLEETSDNDLSEVMDRLIQSLD